MVEAMMILIVSIVLLLVLISGIGGWFFFLTRPFDLLSVICGVVYFPMLGVVFWWIFFSDDFRGSIIEEIRGNMCCHLGLHNWGNWGTHPFKGNWVTRTCKRCKRIEDRRLF